MVFLHRINALLIGILSSFLLLAFVDAHSVNRGPVPAIGLVKDARIRADGTSQRIHAFSHFEITFSIDRPYSQIKLILEPNHDILDHSTKIDYIGNDGSVVQVETIDRNAAKVYKGSSYLFEAGAWEYAGHARIFVYRDGEDPLFGGAFTIFGDDHHVQLRSGYVATKHEEDPHVGDGDDEFMVVVRDSDVNEGIRIQRKRGLDTENSCTSDDLQFNMDRNHKIRRQILNAAEGEAKMKRDVSWNPLSATHMFAGMRKRQVDDGFGGGGFGGGFNLRNSIGSTRGCPSTKRVALMGIVADCEYVASFGNNGERVRQNIISVVNEASTLFESTFNITLGLSQLRVSNPNETCPVNAPSTAPWNLPCNGNATIEDRLNIISNWRGTQRGDGLAFWTQLTNCPTGASVGLAWLGLLCEDQATPQQSNFVSGANVVARTNQEYKVLAHEIGHTFGAVHDCTSSSCRDSAYVASSQCCPFSQSSCDANGRFLMNPSTGDSITQFSACSVGNICSALGLGTVNGVCLTENRNVPTISDGICGNGIVEEGEECDCGGPASCGPGSCCNPDTCTFRPGAVCDPINEECCTATCQFAPSTQVCRQSNGACDPAEMCNGENSSCPADVTSPDGDACGPEGDGLYCASGHCTSRDQQCLSLVGVLQGVDNSTKSCDDTNCQLTCTSPQLGSGVCYGMQQWFIDGTKCGSGTCKSGSCVGNSFFNDARNWIERNMPLVIGLSAGLGGLIVVLILWCLIRSCMRRRKRNKLRAANPPIPIPQTSMGYVPPPYPGTMHGTTSGPRHSRQSSTPGGVGGRRLSRRESNQSHSQPRSGSPRQQFYANEQAYYNEQANALAYYRAQRDAGIPPPSSAATSPGGAGGAPAYMPPVYQPQSGPPESGSAVRYA